MLSFDEVHVGYGRGIVLHGVSLEVPADGVAAVLSHNGPGKSPLLRAAVGLLKPRRGTVRLDGRGTSQSWPRTSGSPAGWPTCRRGSRASRI